MKDKEKKKGSIGVKIFLLIIVILILFLSNKEIQEKVIDLVHDININIKDISLEIINTIPLEERVEEVLPYNNDFILWDGYKLSKINKDGLVEKEKEFNFDEAGIYMGEKNIYVYEKTTGDIYILNGELETLNRIEIKAEIENIVESFGNILVHTKEEYRESLKILNKEGKIIESVITENRNILTYSTNNKNTIYAISTLNLEKSGIRSQIQVFEIGGNSLFDHIFVDEIILYTKYIEEGKLIVMTDNNLYCIEKDEIILERPYRLLKDIHVYEEEIYLLYSNSLEVISKDGEIRYNYSFGEEYNNMIINDKLLILYGDKYIIGLRDGEEIFKYQSAETILSAIKDGKNIIILHEDKIELMGY